jgi:hypothetical protein
MTQQESSAPGPVGAELDIVDGLFAIAEAIDRLTDEIARQELRRPASRSPERSNR